MTRIGAGANALALPYLALIFAVMAMGSSAIFVRLANVPGPVFGFYRMVIAVSLGSVLFRGEARRTVPLPRRYIGLALAGGLFLAVDLWLWNDAVLMTSAANVSLFGNTAVIWVALGAMLLFKERLRSIFWGGLLLALAGVAVILGQDIVSHPALGLGDVLAILSGLFYAAFFLANARARARLNSFVTWWLSSVACALALVVICLALGQPFLGYSLTAYLCMIAVSVLTQLGAYLAINYVLGHLPTSLVSATQLAQPVITALLAIPVLGQAISVSQVIGAILVLTGILAVHRARRPTQT